MPADAYSATPIESTLSAVQELHDEGLFAIDDAALKAKSKWPSYFYGV
jgi:hypothetical protein